MNALLSPPKRYCFFRCLFVCEQPYADFDEIFWKCRVWSKEELIRFWKLSVERTPPPTFKGKITILIF